MGRKTDRPNASGAASRQRILEATFEIAGERGYEGTSIAAVSQRCGLPASSVYWHFRNKDDLFAEVIQHSFDAWFAALPHWDGTAGTAGAPGPRAGLGPRLQATVATYASSPEFWRLGLMLTLEHKVDEPAARARFRAVRRDMIAVLERWWRRELGPEAVAAVPDLPARLAQFTMATTDGLFIASQAADDWDLDRLAAMLAGALEHLARRDLPAQGPASAEPGNDAPAVPPAQPTP